MLTPVPANNLIFQLIVCTRAFCVMLIDDKKGSTMKEISFTVDAFSDRNFGGNAAAVCPLSEWLPDETLLKMAQQHNQSETAFLFVPTAAMSCAGSRPLMRLISAVTPPSQHRT